MKTGLALFTICLLCLGEATSSRAASQSLDPLADLATEFLEGPGPPPKKPIKQVKAPHPDKPKINAGEFDSVAKHYPEYPDMDDDIAYVTYYSDDDDVDEHNIGFAIADDTRFPDVDDDYHPSKYQYYPESYDQGQVGDFTDNGKTDMEQLTLGSAHNEGPSIQEGYDIDDIDSVDVDESDNPAADHLDKPKTFLPESTLEAALPPLERDEDELIDDFDDAGSDHNDGDTMYVLVTSFEDKAHSGKVWVIDQDQSSDGYTLIAGLERPEAVCFDINHEFLYVCDTRNGKQGRIYQYEVNYDDDGAVDEFELRKKTYATVYKGPPANSCSVDEYGNLFFSTTNDMIHIISYLDLWSGFTNQHTTLYSGANGKISGIKGVDVRNSDDLYYVNSEYTDTIGILNKADTKASHLNAGDIDVCVMSNEGSHGVACSDDFCFFITDNQVFGYKISNDHLTIKSTGMQKATGITYGDDHIYIADHATSEIYKIRADKNDEEWIERWVMIPGAYGVYAINAAGFMAVAMLLAFW